MHCSIRLRTPQGFPDGGCFMTSGSESWNRPAVAKRNTGRFPGILRFTTPLFLQKQGCRNCELSKNAQTSETGALSLGKISKTPTQSPVCS